MLQTTLGTEIDNYQTEELSQFEINSFAMYSQEKYLLCKFKGNPTPKYNCHGMAFASRRTNIDQTIELRKILKEDSYIGVNDKEVMAGDLVLYVNATGTGEIEHTGIVLQAEFPKSGLPFILVLSKWGKYKEAIHDVKNCPYNNCILEYWRNNHGYVIGK
jgi:hypothetical protein